MIVGLMEFIQLTFTLSCLFGVILFLLLSEKTKTKKFSLKKLS